MTATRFAGLAAAVLIAAIVAPAPARAQFETLSLVELPPIGAWAEYQVTRRNTSQRRVLRQRVALLARQTTPEGPYLWFQIEMESDDLGPRRRPVITQIALAQADAAARTDYFRKMRELVLQAGDTPALRIGRSLLDLGIEKKLLTGGQGGAGSAVDYAFRDLPAEPVTVPAGTFQPAHKTGLGKAEVVLSNETGERFPVDSILEVWYDPRVPFGLVQSVTKQSGSGPQTETLSLTIDTEERVELVAFGTGATSAVRGPVVDFDPVLARKLVASAPAATATP